MNLEELLILTSDQLNHESDHPFYLTNDQQIPTSDDDQSTHERETSVCTNIHQRKKYARNLQSCYDIQEEYRKKYIIKKYNLHTDEQEMESKMETIMIDIFPDCNPYLSELEMSHLYCNIKIDMCLEILIILHESWQGRIKIVQSFIEQLCNEGNDDDEISDEMYVMKLSKFMYALGIQFTDPRSLIVQKMEHFISQLIVHNPQRFILFAPYFLMAVSKTWNIRIQAINESGVKLGKTIVIFCWLFDTEKCLLHTIFSILESTKHAEVRIECAKLMNFMLKNISLLEKTDADENDENLLLCIKKAILICISDANSDVRLNGYRCLTVFAKIGPIAAKQMMDNMSIAQQTKFIQECQSLPRTSATSSLIVDGRYSGVSRSSHFSGLLSTIPMEILPITSVEDLDFDLTYDVRKQQPKYLDRKFEELMELKKSNPTTVDVLLCKRIDLLNNMPLLLILNDIYSRCQISEYLEYRMEMDDKKSDEEYDFLSVEDFANDYQFISLFPNTYDLKFRHALICMQKFMPNVINIFCNKEKNRYLINDNIIAYVAYTHALFMFIKAYNKAAQFDLWIIPPVMDAEEIDIKSILKRNGLIFYDCELIENMNVLDIADKYLESVKQLSSTENMQKKKLLKLRLNDNKANNTRQHIIFVIDRRQIGRCVKLYSFLNEEILRKPFDDIHMYPEFYIGFSKDLFLYRSRHTIKKKSKKISIKTLTAISENTEVGDDDGNVNVMHLEVEEKEEKKSVVDEVIDVESKEKRRKKRKKKKMSSRVKKRMRKLNAHSRSVSSLQRRKMQNLLGEIVNYNAFGLICQCLSGIESSNCRIYWSNNRCLTRFQKQDIFNLWPLIFSGDQQSLITDELLDDIPVMEDEQFDELYELITSEEIENED